MIYSPNISISLSLCSHTVFGAVYTGILWGVVGLLFCYWDNGYQWVFALVIGSSLSDTFAYVLGRLWGTKKLAPRISPGKTFVGSIGGLLGAVFGIIVSKLLVFYDLTWLETVLLGIVLGVSFQFGDLIESFFKR